MDEKDFEIAQLSIEAQQKLEAAEQELRRLVDPRLVIIAYQESK